MSSLCLNLNWSHLRLTPSHSGGCFVSAEREKTPCERHRESAQSSTSDSGFLSFFRPRPAVGQYVPQCDEHGSYEPTQCHTSIGQCWCVDASGQEIPNTRTGPGNTPLCESLPVHCLSGQGCCPRLSHLRDDLSSPAGIDQTVTPPPVGPTPRPDVHPVAPGTHLLFAQSGKIEHVPLDGYNIKKEDAKPLLHIPVRPRSLEHNWPPQTSPGCRRMTRHSQNILS